jgi:cytochrome c oxidase subunit 5b
MEEIIGTLDNPIIVKSFGDEQYAGCTGYPADSHVTIWLTVSLPLTSKR